MGKKAGKSKKGKKGDDEQMQTREAIVAYKISCEEKKKDSLLYDLDQLQQKVKRGKLRNTKLKEENEYQISELVKASREMEAKQETIDPVEGRKRIENALNDVWLTAVDEEKNVVELGNEIKRKEKEVEDEHKVLDYWREYRDVGSVADKNKILLYEQELQDMQNTFDEMSEFLAKVLTKTKTDVTFHTNKTITSVKEAAANEAIRNMDKQDTNEMKDHEWLKNEKNSYMDEVKVLQDEVELIEQDNLRMMANLFDCKVDDLKITKKLFLTQFDDDTECSTETKSHVGILEQDLLSCHDLNTGKSFDEGSTSGYSSMKKTSSVKSQRPKSATLKAIEEKLSAFDEASDEAFFSEEEEETINAGDGLADNLFENRFSLENENIDNYLKLGPVEIKLLHVCGKQMKIIEPTPYTEEEIEHKQFNPDSWPVSHSDLSNLVS